jgi:uncharacterized protein
VVRDVSALAVVAVAACGGGGGRPDAIGDRFDRAALIERIGRDLLVPVYEQLAPATADLVAAIDADCSGPGAEQAWRDAIDVWHRADAVLIGPAAMDSKAIRDRIYSWPIGATSTCAVDQEVVAYWADPVAYDVATRLPGRRSLVAIEYLLFTPTLEHTCPSQSPPPGWATMTADDRIAARCGLAGALAADVAAQAEIVRAGFPGYVTQLAGSTSLHDAVNVVSDSLFFVDTMVKDMKLGQAAGIVVNDCATVQQPCLIEVEHRHADHGKAAILINLETLHAAFTGTIAGEPGIGFDDFLIEVGADAVAARMVGSLDGAIAAVVAIDGELVGALANDYQAVVDAHAAVKLFTDDLKSQFLTVLGLDIPDDVHSDND